MPKNIYADQANNKTGAVGLDPITISVSRIERRLSEVSSSVNIISKKEIEDSNAKSVPDLLRNIEGVYMYDSSGVGTSGRINMRGFWGGMSTHQLILIDGIPQNKGKDKLVDWDLIPLDNIERIEIIRGPVSALYGDNALSGVVNIITQKPSLLPELRVAGSCGTFNTQHYMASTSGVLRNIGYYLGIGSKLTDGFRRHGDYENVYLNGKLNLLNDGMQELKLSFDYHEKENGAYPWALTETQVEEDRRQARPGSENDMSDAQKMNLGLDYHRDINDMSNVLGRFYYKYDGEESFYTSGSSGDSTKEQLEDENAYGLFLRLNTNPEFLGMEHSFTAGIDLERSDFDYEEYAAPYQIRGNIQDDYKVERNGIGPYFQDEIKLLKPFKVIAGMRYDFVEFDFTDNADGDNSKERDMSKITPRCGLVYTYKEASNLFANYAQAFRTPTIGQMFTYGSVANPDLDPEEAINYEVGIRHQFTDYLKANASAYWMKLDNEIWYDFATSQYNNYGKTSHRGLETGVDFKVHERLKSFVNYSYTKAKNENGDYEGNYLTNIPVHKGSLGVGYETSFGLKTNVIVTKVGSSYLDSANDDKLSGYTSVDMKIDYEHDWFTVFLAIDNLSDERYNSYGYKSFGTKYFNPAPGRTFTFGTKANFW